MTLTRQQLGELSANFLDMLDHVPQPIITAGFVAIYASDEGKKGIVTRTTHSSSSSNIEMFHDAATCEHAAFVLAAGRAVDEANGIDPDA